MVYRHSFGDLRTGRIVEEFLVGSMSWSRPLNDAGTASGTLNLEDADVRAADPRYTCAPARSFWMIEWDERPVWGGIVWTHRYSRKPKRRLQLGAAGLWSLFDHRKVLPAATYALAPAAAADVGWSGISLGTQAKRLVQLATAHVGGDLPLVLPADVAGFSDRTYPAYNLPWVGEMLTNLTNVQDGPDIEFVPERVPGNEAFIRWRMRIGEPYLEQTGDSWRFDDTVPDTPVVDLGAAIDGSRMATRGWVPGEGQERDLLLALAENPALVAAGYPLLEVEDTSHRTTQQTDTLTAHAEDLVDRRSRPIEQWSLTVRADAPDALLGQYAPGDAIVVQLEGDGYLPDGEQHARILAMSGGSGSSNVSFDLAPTSALV